MALVAESRNTKLKADTMMLSGHEGEIFSCKFDKTGNYLATASADKEICNNFNNFLVLWNVYGDCLNYGVLKGHSGTILDICWFENDKIVSASTDNSVMIWDTNRMQLIRKYKHKGIVNACGSFDNLIVTVSDDMTCCIWDSRQKLPVFIYEHEFPLTATCIHQKQVFVGGIDNEILCIDLCNESIAYTLKSHSDTISGLSIDNYLVSASMDNSVKVWDTKPLIEDRLKATFDVAQGFEKNLIKPSIKNDLIACGSADRTINIFNFRTYETQKLLGHKGCVNQVDFHPSERILASCSSDRHIILGSF